MSSLCANIRKRKFQEREICRSLGTCIYRRKRVGKKQYYCKGNKKCTLKGKGKITVEEWLNGGMRNGYTCTKYNVWL